MLLARYTNWNRPCSALWRRLRLQRVKMRNDAINMEVNEGLLAFGAEEEGTVGGVVHEEVFGEDGGGKWCVGVKGRIVRLAVQSFPTTGRNGWLLVWLFGRRLCRRPN